MRRGKRGVLALDAMDVRPVGLNLPPMTFSAWGNSRASSAPWVIPSSDGQLSPAAWKLLIVVHATGSAG
jgi:hypothetical protein